MADDNPVLQQMRAMIANARQDFLTRSERFAPFSIEEETLRQSIAQAVGEVSAHQALDAFEQALAMSESRRLDEIRRRS